MGGLFIVRASIRARTPRNASHAEQSAPPDGTIIELRPRGLQIQPRLDARWMVSRLHLQLPLSQQVANSG